MPATDGPGRMAVPLRLPRRVRSGTGRIAAAWRRTAPSPLGQPGCWPGTWRAGPPLLRYFAPLAALLGVSLTVARSLLEGIQYAAGFLLGAALAIPVGQPRGQRPRDAPSRVRPMTTLRYIPGPEADTPDTPPAPADFAAVGVPDVDLCPGDHESALAGYDPAGAAGSITRGDGTHHYYSLRLDDQFQGV